MFAKISTGNFCITKNIQCPKIRTLTDLVDTKYIRQFLADIKLVMQLPAVQVMAGNQQKFRIRLVLYETEIKAMSF